jgi:hypothetical protein
MQAFGGKENEMEKVTLNSETTDKIIWPASCPGCGAHISENEGFPIDLKVIKSAKAILASGTPKTILVKLCPRCTSRKAWAERIEKFGMGFAGIIFILAVVRPPRNELEWTGAGAAFWLFAILGGIGEIRKRSVIGLKATRVSKGTWRFRFRNKLFTDAFVKANQTIVKKD